MRRRVLSDERCSCGGRDARGDISARRPRGPPPKLIWLHLTTHNPLMAAAVRAKPSSPAGVPSLCPSLNTALSAGKPLRSYLRSPRTFRTNTLFAMNR